MTKFIRNLLYLQATRAPGQTQTLYTNKNLNLARLRLRSLVLYKIHNIIIFVVRLLNMNTRIQLGKRHVVRTEII